MAHLTIVAHIHAKPDAIDAVKSSLLSLIEPTRAEAGCVQYDLHQDNEDPAHFMFFELWESRPLWRDHMASDHIAAHRGRVEGKIERADLYEMTQAG